MNYRLLLHFVAILLLGIAAYSPLIAQSQGNISGKVINEKNEPLAGVTVQLQASGTTVVTNDAGEFAIAANSGAVLVFSSSGYTTQEKTITRAGEFITVIMKEMVIGLDDVVVIGYGTRAKRDVTSAISSIDAETITKSVGMSAENAMQGTMSGVQVSGISGDPMARPVIRIRGTNTWGVSDPLYVIDGIPVTEMGAGIEAADLRIADVRGPLNIMALINPNDIESISVLKDASAAAIYGVRAANGVVLITTKKGRKEKPSIDAATRYGVQNITQKLNWLTTPQYTKFVQDVFASNTDLNPSEDNKGRFDPNDPLYLGNSPTYNWQDAVRNKNAATQDYSVKVSGGTDNTDYYVSLGYTDMQGTLLVNNLNRYSGAVKVNTKINEWIKTGINYRLVNATGVENDGQYVKLMSSAPWQPIYATNNIAGYNGYAYVVGGIQPDGSYLNQKLYGQGTRVNVLGLAHTNDTRYESWRNMGNVYLELTPLKGLSVKGTISMDRYITTRYMFTDYDANSFNYSAGDPRSIAGGKSVGAYEERETFNNNVNKEFTVNYQKSIENHNLDLLFNFSDQQYNSKYKMSGTDYMTTKKDYLRNLGGERSYTSTESDQLRWALQGYLFRVAYNYASKYYLDATIRRDGSARFAPENRWGTFPSVSAAWRLKSEAFLADVHWLNDLKLRAGWGQLGNQEVRDMAYLSAISKKPHYGMGSASPDGRPAAGTYHEGATIFGIPNKDLTWEKSETFNIGFDAQLFTGLSFSAEYYHKTTHGILQAIDLPPSVGVIEAPVANIAKVQNKGFEFNANWQKQLGDFSYGVGANLTTTANKVLETYKHIPTAGGTVEEGYSMFYHKAYKTAGIFQTDQQAQDWLAKYQDVNYQRSKIGAGDFYFQDLRGAPKDPGTFYSAGADGSIDAFDMVYIGKSIPGFFYGANLNAAYKGIDFSAIFAGVGDVTRYNVIKANTFFATEADNVTDIVYKAWTPQNQQSNYPRLVFGDPAQNLRNSDFFYESGAYLRLQNMQLGYTLPASFYTACKYYIRNVRLYAGASNVFTITKYTGFDPENDTYPTPKMFFVGLNIKF